MTDPRAALEKLTVALERHFEAATSSRDPDHPMVVAAAQDLAEAFDEYDEALYEATEVATPLAIYGEEFEVEDEDDEGGPYAGLESEDYEDEDDDEDDEDDDEFEDDEDDEDEEEGSPAR
jgi:pyruvate/2-oxoacid:ferredoxin oxidoreductase alpha subunit